MKYCLESLALPTTAVARQELSHATQEILRQDLAAMETDKKAKS